MNLNVSDLFLLSLAVFGIGYAVLALRSDPKFLGGLVGVAAGVMGVLAIVQLFNK